MKKIATLAAAAAVVLALTGCGISSEIGQADPAPAETSAPAADALETTEPVEATEPEPEPEPEPEVGSRENPGVPESDVATFTNGDDELDITVGAATWDANGAIAEENMFNDAAPEGTTYVLLPVTTTYRGPNTSLPWLDVDVKFVSASGRSYETASVVTPGDLSDVSEMYDGGTATGNLAFAIPLDDREGGTWAVTAWYSDPLFFAAQ